MEKIQGYVALPPNEPSGRGLFYFTVEGAKDFKERFDRHSASYPNTENSWDLNYWKEKPLPVEIYSLIVGEKIE